MPASSGSRSRDCKCNLDIGCSEHSRCSSSMLGDVRASGRCVVSNIAHFFAHRTVEQEWRGCTTISLHLLRAVEVAIAQMQLRRLQMCIRDWGESHHLRKHLAERETSNARAVFAKLRQLVRLRQAHNTIYKAACRTVSTPCDKSVPNVMHCS